VISASCVCASGLLNIAMPDHNAAIDPVSIIPPDSP
jgi:hypothetical protein